MGAPFDADAGFDAVLTGRLVEPVFQPVIALHDRRPVGFEALARGPQGRFHDAPALFAAAARAGRSAELDWLCADAAARHYRKAALPELALFVNLNPDTLATEPPVGLRDLYIELTRHHPVVLEITEQAVMREPGRLLKAVVDARSRSARIALDDVGADPASLAAMPLINPDIIKLDRSIVQSRSRSWAVSQVVNAVLDEAQRRGAQILAEGIERREDLDAARAMGATLGQGWLFGRPGPLPERVEPSAEPLARVQPREVACATPFEVLAPDAQVHPTTDEMYATMAGNIENQAAQTANPAILAVNIGDGELDDAARIGYNQLAGRGINVFVLGRHVTALPGGRVRGIPLADTDPLLRERSVLFVGSRYGSGTFARRHGSNPRDAYRAGVCYDAEKVIEAMLTLVNRLPS
ncbi:EAL domain-containing protein [Asanoa sp. NPDC049573]|uniref:EAL domain-containing protein n=1 Tax=Asanoa sp. NPDC049573 TaxID=3155396 RepID=UPI00344AD778